ncbi:hypothetical protein ABZ491_28920 [Micromonospora rifamycinica]|uniref:hypothetical protein n=1 Tax=Micromonospora rifamycinica TaxID=291594 RepID=UPI003416C83A
MTAGAWPVVVLLAGAAVVVAWPVRSSRRRRRRVLGPPPDSVGSPESAGRMRLFDWTVRRRRTGLVGVPGPTGSIGTGMSTGATGEDPDRGASAVADGRPATGRRPLWWVAAGRPRRVVLLVGFVGAGTGGLTAGPVAAALLAGYGMLAARAAYRRRAAGRIVRERRRRLDLLGAFAADLRAGLPAPTLDPLHPPSAVDLLAGPGPAPAFGSRSTAGRRPEAGPPTGGGRAGSSGVPVGFPSAPRPGEMTPGGPDDDPTGTDRLERLARSAVRLADRTGAPLAELLERVEADARAFDRGLAGAAAQAAGANATALLLAGLPLGGIALGYGIGVDPLAVLLHTPVGAGCALAAMGLQVGGLLWAERLGTTPGGRG